MEERRARYLGIDLGTTNSAAAIFDGDQVTIVRNRDGAILTPSVVHINSRDRTYVGDRARRKLDSDPENTHAGFKRLMGTSTSLEFPAATTSRTPIELSAAVLRSLREDVKEQLGFVPERAVISVPALFELPQTRATADAAEQAGFTQVELIQEPVASALAAGWRADDEAGPWLVYDLGGGTFDVSLLETRDGLLRVVGHDGDNFLGGRDIDRLIVDWTLAQLAADGTTIDRKLPANAAALRRLGAAAEEAKIDLTRRPDTDLSIIDVFETDDGPIDVDVTLTRATLDGLIQPLLDRTISVCDRLLAANGLRPDQLIRVVLVGGPTVMPSVRQRIQHAFGARLVDGLDPMTLVARGAALYAATAGLDAHPSESVDTATGRRLWLQYPTMSSDLFPHVAGRLLDGPEPAPAAIRFVRDGWEGEWTPIGADGGVVSMLELTPGSVNVFRVEGRDASQRPTAVLPAQITIVQGVTLTDPPLSRSIGVALASDRVQTYLERGTPLPAKRTFTHRTVQAVAAGTSEVVLSIPIVQGEFDQAHLCRLVGRIELTGKALPHTLPSGSEIEVTLDVDRGGRLAAQALVPSLDLVFEQVAHLVAPEAPPETLRPQLTTLQLRLTAVRQRAHRHEDTDTLDRLYDLEWGLQDAILGLDNADGGDEDSAQRARRTLLDIDGTLEALENAQSWPELDRDARTELAASARWVEELGTPAERAIFAETAAAAEQARGARSAVALQRQLRVIRDLRLAAFYRHPEAWNWAFEHAAAQVHQCADVATGQAVVQSGRQAQQRGDEESLKQSVRELWKLLPDDVRAQADAHNSGVR